MKNQIYNPEKNQVYWDKLLEYPEFQALEKTPQNEIWHAEGNAFIHTCRVAQCMLDKISMGDYPYKPVVVNSNSLKEVLVLSALLHDVGKPVVTALGEDGLYHCKNHAHEGEKIAREFLEDYPLIDKAEIDMICTLVKYHMQPLYLLKAKNPTEKLLKLVNDMNLVDFQSLLLLKYCDCEGSIQIENDEWESTLKKVEQLFYQEISFPAGTQVSILKIDTASGSPYGIDNHPNGINQGYTRVGKLSYPVTKGFRVYVGGILGFSSSPVTKIINKNLFETRNSVYAIQEIIN